MMKSKTESETEKCELDCAGPIGTPFHPFTRQL